MPSTYVSAVSRKTMPPARNTSGVAPSAVEATSPIATKTALATLPNTAHPSMGESSTLCRSLVRRCATALHALPREPHAHGAGDGEAAADQVARRDAAGARD